MIEATWILVDKAWMNLVVSYNLALIVGAAVVVEDTYSVVALKFGDEVDDDILVEQIEQVELALKSFQIEQFHYEEKAKTNLTDLGVPIF